MEINECVNNYFQFLKDRTLVIEQKSGWTQIRTPFINVFNDTIDIYARKDKEKIFLSDDGETLRNLELAGVDISRSPKRNDFLNKILLNYGVSLNDNELIVESAEKEFPQKKFNLLSAITEANDLYALAKHTITSLFLEDVKEYFDEQELTYTPSFMSRGASGIEFTFDFQIAHKKTEILIKTFNSVNKLNLPQFLFTWDDVRQVREKQTAKHIEGLAFINDENKEIQPEFLSAIKTKGADFILWSERHFESNVNKLKKAA